MRIDIETDGSITPREAFGFAAEILVNQFSEVAKGFDMVVEAPPRSSMPIAREEREESDEHEGMEEEVFKTKLDTLKLSSRTLNALREAGIKTVGGVARKREETLREIEGLGDKGIQEIKKALGNFGITLRQ